jgi:hypothetical protein
MSVLERHIAFRVPRQCPRERKGCSCSRRHRQSSALLTAARGRAAGPAVDRPGPSVRPAPVVAATAGLVMADQDSSPTQRAGRPATRGSALHRRRGSPSQPVDSEQVSRWRPTADEPANSHKPLLTRAAQRRRPG